MTKHLLTTALVLATKLAFGALPVLQGLSSGEQAQFVVLSEESQDLRFRAQGPGSAALSVTASVTDAPPIASKLWHVTVVGLKPGPTYSLELFDAKEQLLDKRKFQARDLKASRFKVAIGSCMNELENVTFSAKNWQDLASARPDYLFLIGDNVYVDKFGAITRSAQVWERYAQVRRSLELFKLDPLIPTLAIWDDHDYGINDGAADFVFKAEATRVFEAFYAQKPVAGILERGPGVSFLFNAWKHKFCFMDDRSFRAPRLSGGADGHWGKAQGEWLQASLNTAAAPAWLINGGQFFGGYQKDESYEGNHPEAFTAFKERLKASPSKVLFISGDRHFAELMEIEPEALGYKTWELTTSPIQANSWPAQNGAKNPRRIAAATETWNYGLIQVDGKKLLMSVLGPGKKVHFKKKVIFPDLD